MPAKGAGGGREATRMSCRDPVGVPRGRHTPQPPGLAAWSLSATESQPPRPPAGRNASDASHLAAASCSVFCSGSGPGGAVASKAPAESACWGPGGRCREDMLTRGFLGSQTPAGSPAGALLSLITRAPWGGVCTFRPTLWTPAPVPSPLRAQSCRLQTPHAGRAGGERESGSVSGLG